MTCKKEQMKSLRHQQATTRKINQHINVFVYIASISNPIFCYSTTIISLVPSSPCFAFGIRARGIPQNLSTHGLNKMKNNNSIAVIIFYLNSKKYCPSGFLFFFFFNNLGSRPRRLDGAVTI